MSVSRLPSKLFFRIGEVAGLVGVEPHELRYWEREFRSIRPTKSAKGQRVYSRRDVENLLRVRDLLYRDGFTIAGAKKRLQRGGAEPAVELLSDEDGDERDERDEREDAREPSGAISRELEVALTPSAQLPSLRVRLSALRVEVASFLDELEPEEPRSHERQPHRPPQQHARRGVQTGETGESS